MNFQIILSDDPSNVSNVVARFCVTGKNEKDKLANAGKIARAFVKTTMASARNSNGDKFERSDFHLARIKTKIKK